MILKFDSKIWSWNLTLEFEIEILIPEFHL